MKMRAGHIGKESDGLTFYLVPGLTFYLVPHGV